MMYTLSSHPRTQAVLALGLLTALSVGQEGQAGVHWIFPPAGGETLTFHHNDTINVTYTSSFPTPILYTFCQGSHVDQVKIMNVPGNNASVLVKLAFDHDDAKCWFDLKPDSDGGKGSNSDSFLYASNEDERATIGLSSTSTSSTSTATSSSSTTTTSSNGADGTGVAATRTNIPATTTSSSVGATSTGSSDTSTNGLSVGAQAGIGVGAGLAGIAIGALAIFMLLRRRKQGAIANANPSTDPSMGQSHYDTSILSQQPQYAAYSDQAFSGYQSRSHTTSPDNTLLEGAASVGTSATNYTPIPQELDAPHTYLQELPSSRHM